MTTPASNTPIFPGNARPVVKSDSTRFSPSAIYVGGAGSVVIVPADAPDSTGVTFQMQSGSTVPVMVIGVLNASTATDMVALY